MKVVGKGEKSYISQLLFHCLNDSFKIKSHLRGKGSSKAEDPVLEKSNRITFNSVVSQGEDQHST